MSDHNDPNDVAPSLMSPLTPHVIVMFGASGDLARRKLLPGLLHLSRAGLVPARAACDEFASRTGTTEQWEAFERKLSFVGSSDGAAGLVAAVAAAERELGGEPRRLHYLSVPPSAARGVVRTLGEANLVDSARNVPREPDFPDRPLPRQGSGAEHPGLPFRQRTVRADLESRPHRSCPDRRARNAVARRTGSVLRIDRRLPRHGRDPSNVVRGQYLGYRDEPGVSPHSETETFIALRCEIDNWRWAGVPFFLRTGKRMAEGARIISIAFREPPKSMFPAGSGVGSQGPDHLTFDLADSSRLSLSFYGKRPGPGMKLDKLSLQFALHETGGNPMSWRPTSA